MIRTLSKVKLEKKVVILRTGMDVQTKNNKILDEWRILQGIPTIKHLLSKKNSVIILSHRGRPNRKSKKDSMEIISKVLSKKLKKKVTFLKNYKGKGVEKSISNIKPGEVFFMENLRFWKGEVNNDSSFAKKLASYGDVYVNDSFSTAHRKNASTYGIMKYLPSYAGLAFEKEYLKLKSLLRKPKKPFVVIIGGSKSKDKIFALESLVKKSDKILVGGTVSFLFLAQLNKPTKVVRKLLKTNKVIVPEDFMLKNGSNKSSSRLTKRDVALDIGKNTIRKFVVEIQKAKTVLWNGPMGKFEEKKFSKGSMVILSKLKSSKSEKVFGGGETLALLEKKSMRKNITIISGGGSMLGFLCDKKLPSVEMLEKNAAKNKVVKGNL